MNKQLTKEECIKALDEMETIYYEHDDSFCGMQSFSKSIETIAKLINEHFDNPPLKFDELEIGTWYWDNKDKEWCKYIDDHVFEYIDGYSGTFDENRFYRYEVKKNENGV